MIDVGAESAAMVPKTSARKSPMVRETVLTPNDFIYPMFVVPGKGVRKEDLPPGRGARNHRPGTAAPAPDLQHVPGVDPARPAELLLGPGNSLPGVPAICVPPRAPPLDVTEGLAQSHPPAFAVGGVAAVFQPHGRRAAGRDLVAAMGQQLARLAEFQAKVRDAQLLRLPSPLPAVKPSSSNPGPSEATLS